MLMHDIARRYPGLHFTPHDCFVYSPEAETIFYNEDQMASDPGRVSLLHEIGHARLGHRSYRSDIALLNMEVEAWIFARDAAAEIGLSIDEVHIQGCLESYRIWLYKRSRCPECEHHGIQIKPTRYRCFICYYKWKVTRNLTLQPHRLRCPG